MKKGSSNSTRQWLPSFWWALAILVVALSGVFDGSIFLYRKYVRCPSRTNGSVRAPAEMSVDMKKLANLIEPAEIDGVRTWQAFEKSQPSSRVIVSEWSEEKGPASVTVLGTEKKNEAVVIAIPLRGEDEFEGKENLVIASGVINYLKDKRLMRDVRFVAYDEKDPVPFLSDLKAIAGVIVMRPGAYDPEEILSRLPGPFRWIEPSAVPYFVFASPLRSRAYLNVVASVFQRFSHTCSECLREPAGFTRLSREAETERLKPYPVVVMSRVASAGHVAGATVAKTLGLAKVAEGLSLDPTPATLVR